MEWKVKSAQKMTRLLLFLGLILFWLTACTMGQLSNEPKARDCSRLQEPDLRSLEFGKLRSAEMQKWLKEASPFTEEDIRIEEEANGNDFSFSWENNQARYVASFHQDVLVQILVFWNYSSQPIGDEMLACLGEPELYRVVPFLEEDGYYTHLSLWYLQKGLVIETTNPREKDEVPIFDGEIVMEQMYITAPGTVEEVIKSVIYQGVGLDNFSDELLLSLKPWSRAWEEIVVEEW